MAFLVERRRKEILQGHRGIQYLENGIYLPACRIKVKRSPQQRKKIKADLGELGDIFNILYHLLLLLLLLQQ
jgi:hypothetical protein